MGDDIRSSIRPGQQPRLSYLLSLLAFRSNVSLEERKHVLHIGYEITRRVQAKLPKFHEANSILVLLLNNICRKANVRVSAERISVIFKQNYLRYFFVSQAFFWICRE